MSGRCHLVDAIVRRIKRVVRSTYAAELNALIESIEIMFITQLVPHQVKCSTGESHDQLLQHLSLGTLYPPIDLCIDAKSVYDSVTCTDVSTPLEASLLVHVLSVRDRLSTGTIRSMNWVDTRDMLADGLNKGSVPRIALVKSMQGQAALAHPCLTSARPRSTI